MGCGKSTLGKKLARKAGYDFLDSDSEIEKATKLSVSEIFEQYGESYFRDLESDFLDTIKGKSRIVLSTGGGMPCYNDNMFKIKEFGASFYLKLSPFELTRRLREAKVQRPLLATFKTEDDLYYYIKDKLGERRAFYEMADYTLNGKQQHVNEILTSLDNF